jgi:hypothetical protein
MGKTTWGSLRPFLLTAAVSLIIISGIYWSGILNPRDATPPIISIWYGPRQVFGASGVSQRWVNILGNASDNETKLSRLEYHLNDGPAQPLQMGPDQRRLLRPGDFNVEIDPDDLHEGDNRLEIDAVNRAGLHTQKIVTVSYLPQSQPVSLPYKINWTQVKDAQQVLQIVDGKWNWDASGIRPQEIGYDRMLTVGDAHWTDYTVTVPVLVHGIDPAGFHDKNSGKQASFAVDLRWVGHSDIPVQCPQPHCGWDPAGDFNKFFFKEDKADYLAMKVGEKETGYPTQPYTFHPGDIYTFKVSVETVPQGVRYRMKVWEASTEQEPDWIFDRVVSAEKDSAYVPEHGAFALVAHYMDVTIGDILVEPNQGH